MQKDDMQNWLPVCEVHIFMTLLAAVLARSVQESDMKYNTQ